VIAEIAGLQPQADYKMRVKALTKSTEGEWAEEKGGTRTSRLTENEPPDPPEKFCKFFNILSIIVSKSLIKCESTGNTNSLHQKY
jgi:hypothetical protein